MLTKLSLKNIAIVFLVTALVIVAGVYSIPRLGIEFLPEIDPPVVAVITVYPNASPNAVAHDVTKPIEEAVATVQNISKLNSVSNENVSVVVAEFSYGINMDNIEEKVTAEVNKAKGDLPDSIIEPKIVRYNMNDSPIMALSVTSEGGQAATSKLVKDVIKPKIEKIPGVANVEVSGLAEKRYVVILDPEKLKEHELSSLQVVQALKANNLTMPGGTLDIDTKSIPIQTISDVNTKEDLENLIISVGVDQDEIKKKQEKAIKDAAAEQQRALKKAFSSQQQILMREIQKMIEDAMKQQMQQMQGQQSQGSLPPGITSQGMQPGAQGQSKEQSGSASGIVYKGNQRASVIPVSTNSMSSLGSMGTSAAGSFSAAGAGSSEDIPLKLVYLKDIAVVTEDYDRGASIYRTNQKPSIGIMIKKGSKQNTVAVADAVKKELPELERSAGNGVKIEVTRNQADYIKKALNGMIREGILGAIFAVLVIFFFLRNIRSTLVAAISIPLSVVIGLIFLWAADISLNMFTLGGITISVGRVVDDSIVVLENIFRHMQTTKEKLITTITRGTGEVARAITASTITTVAVFLPLGFVEGFVGELFRPFAYTVSLTLLASLLVAVTIVPVLASKFMSRKNIGHLKDDGVLRRTYLKLLKWSIKHKAFVLVVSMVLFAASLALYPYIPKNFISSPNQGTFTVNMEMPVGTSLAKTSEVAAKIESVLAKDNRIKTVRALVGTAQGSYASGGGSNVATIYATIKDKDKKDIVVKDTRMRLKGIDGDAKIAVSGGEEIAGMGNTVEVNISASSEEDLRDANSVLLKEFSKINSVDNIKSNLSQSKPELRVEVNEVVAMKKGLTAIQIAAAVRGAVNGESATTIEKDGLSTDVYVMLDKDKVKDRDTLAALPVVSPIDGPVRLDSVANVAMANGPVNITRINQERSATITMEPISKNTGAVTRDVQKAIDRSKMPDGASASVEGVSAMMEKGFSSMGMALLVAILLVYIVMVATFRSLLHPFTMLFSLPLAVIGAAAALYMTGRELGMPSLIGLLMLIGIVVTNAIVLLDLVQQLRSRGYSTHDAIIKAGATRMRPILMTALATILALIPMALGTTEGGIISAPLATVVIGGLLTSTILTLIIIPVLYMVFEGLRERLGIADSSYSMAGTAEEAT